MKRMMSITAIALFVVAITGCCCMKSKSCGNKDAAIPMPEASQPAE